MEDLLRHILDLSRRMAGTHDLAVLLNEVMDEAIRLIGAERGYVVLVQPDGAPSGALDFRVRRGPGGQNLADVEDQVSESILRQVVETGKPLVLRDAMQDPCFGKAESVVILGLRSVMCVPLTSRGDTIGAIYVENRSIRGRFSQNDVAPLVVFANQAAVAIENARLLQSLQRSHDELEMRVQERTAELSEANALLKQEIAEREQAEGLLRAQRDLGLALSAVRDLGETLRLCVETAIRVSGMDCGGVYLVNEFSGSLDLAFHEGLPADFVARASHYAADSPNACLVMDGKPIYTNYQELDVPVNDTKRREGLQAIAIVPVPHEDRLIACLNVASHTLNQVPDFARTALETIAIQVGSAIARSKAEAALEQSRANLQILFDSLEDFLFVLDMKGRILDFNRVVLNRLGYSRVELLGESVLKMHAPDLHEEAAAIVADMIAGQADLCPIPIMAKDGTLIPVETKVTRGHWNGREALFGISRDISERQRAEETLRRRAEELNALQATVLDITVPHDLPTLLETIVVRAARLLDAPMGGLYLRDAEQARCVVSYNTPHDYRGIVLEFGEGASGTVAETGAPLLINDYRTWDGRASVFEEEQPFRAVLAVPMIWQGQVTGVIDVVHSAENRIFTPADLDLLTRFANHAAIAVENARLYGQTRRDAEAKATLLQEVNHRVKNNLTGIIGLIDTERRYASGEERTAIQATMDRLTQRIIGLAEVHDILSQSGWSPVCLSDLAERIVSSTLSASPFKRQVSVDVTASPVRVSPRQANNLALILNELVTNTIKYAASEQGTTHIAVRVAGEGTDAVLLEYRDDGPGYPEDVLRLEHHGVGMYLVRNLVDHVLGGSLILTNDDGAVATIRFQVEEGDRT